jgi:hypothetical protein
MNTPEDNESGTNGPGTSTPGTTTPGTTTPATTGPGTTTPGTTTPAIPGLATQGIPHTGQQDGDQDYGDQQRLNIWLVWILGTALLALIVGIVYLSISKEAVSLPTGLTSLASLIAGGLLALLNPVHGSRTAQKSGKPSQKGNNAKPGG